MFKKDKEKKPKSKVRKIIDWVVTGLTALLLVGFGTIFIVSKTSKNQTVFGVTYQRVITDSMVPVYKVSDIIVVNKTSPESLLKRYNEGKDVDVSFNPSKVVKWENSARPNKEALAKIGSMTHRLCEVTYNPEAEVEPLTGLEYHYTFKAHGINTESQFCKIGEEYGDCTNQMQVFHEDALIGRVTRKSGFLTFATTVWGLLVLLMVPCIYLITASVFDICKVLDDKGEDGEEPQKIGDSNDPLAGLSPKEKEKLKKKMLDEMLGKK